MFKSRAVKDLEDAMAAARLMALTPQEERYVTASEYYWGNQYDGLKDWSDDAPLHDKKPKIRVRLTRKAVDTANSYLFGAKRKPSFRAGADLGELQEELDDALEDAQRAAEEEATDPEGAADQYRAAAERYKEARDALEEARAQLQRDNATVDRLVDEVDLGLHMQEVGRLGLLHGAVGIAFHKHTDRESGEEYFDLEFINGAGAKPIFGRDDRARAREEGVRYSELLEIDERWRSAEVEPITGNRRHFLHRRRWTTNRTIEYHPVEITNVRAPEDLPEWNENEEETVEHDLGFVPATWIPNGLVAGEYEGVPLVDDAEFTLEDALNYTLSQTGRGIQYNQDPRTVFVDVDNLTSDPIRIGADNSIAVNSTPIEGGTQAAVKTLELQGTGQKVAIEYINKLKSLFFEMAHVVLHDPEQAAGVMSGTALERMLEPMLQMVLSLRPVYGSRLADLVGKMFEAHTGREIPIAAVWGPIVTPTAEDREVAVRTDVQALDAGLIDERTAVESVAPYYGIEDVDAYLERRDSQLERAGTAMAETRQELEDVLAEFE